MTWSYKLPTYSIVAKQKNKIKGYEISIMLGLDVTVLGFVKTLKEAKKIIIDHKIKNKITENLYNSQYVKE